MRGLDLVNIQRNQRSQEKLQMHEFEGSNHLCEQLLELPTLFQVAKVICAATSRLIREFEKTDDFKKFIYLNF